MRDEQAHEMNISLLRIASALEEANRSLTLKTLPLKEGQP